tara:strand:+ start:449 stop:661 length:213 start_codon:yes stop_codon:yes gene_type:complete
MTIEERLANLEKGYKELCQAHDRNKQMHLLIKNNLDSMNQNFKEMTTLIKGQQQVNLQIIQKLQELEGNQ